MTEVNEQKTKRMRLVSQIILIATAAVWFIWDLIPAINNGRGDTLSENMRDWGRSLLVLPMLWGALGSHFFFNFGQASNYVTRFYILLAISVVAIIVNVAVYYLHPIEYNVYWRVSAYVVGAFLGVFLWGQSA
jgi:hypothetical protein